MTQSDKILFLGNSITLHGPKEDIGWSGNWGMAASGIEKDYVHILLERFQHKYGTLPTAKIENIADFEREYAVIDVEEKFKCFVDFNADIIILAIGENVPALTEEPDQTAFSIAVNKLLTVLTKNRKPAIFVRGTFWADLVKDEILKKVCLDFGGYFVDISTLCKDETNFARAERDYRHDGVAAHPGDAGMMAIANAIWEKAGKNAN